MRKTLAINTRIKAVVNNNGVDIEIERPVTIIQERPGFLIGSVGKAKFYWEPKENKFPLVIIDRKRHYNNKICAMVKSFLVAWKNAMQANTKTTVCYQEHDLTTATRKDAACKIMHAAANYISGHPLWLTKAKKKILCTVRSTGLVYESRRIVPKKLQSFVESHVKQYCYKCLSRSVCNKPCYNPMQSVAHDALSYG